MERSYGSAKVVIHDGAPPQWRVLVGREATEEAAGQLADRIRGDREGQLPDAFVVRLDIDGAADSL
jgi:hypothetical protein